MLVLGGWFLRLIKVTLGWILGITAYEFISSLLRNQEMDFQFIINFSLAGFIGILIGFGLRNVFKKTKDNN